MMSGNGSGKTVDFSVPRRGSVLGRGQLGHLVRIHSFLGEFSFRSGVDRLHIAIYLLLVFSTMGHGLDGLSIKQWYRGGVCQDCYFHFYRGWGSCAWALLCGSLY